LARALLLGCGCCARGAGAILLERGWGVRGTSRSAEGLEAIAAAGIEPAEADPDRVGSLTRLLGDVTVVAWLLSGSPADPDRLRSLNGERLGSLLAALVDTPVRGVVYEALPPAAGAAADSGRALVEDAESRWRIPTRTVVAERSQPDAWAAAVADAVEAVVGL
jgi:hypothetical protein